MLLNSKSVADTYLYRHDREYIEKGSLYSHWTHTRKADKTLNIHLPSFPTKQSGPWATSLTCVRDFGLILKFVTSLILSLWNSVYPVEFKTLAPGILISKNVKFIILLIINAWNMVFPHPSPNSNDAFPKSLIIDLIFSWTVDWKRFLFFSYCLYIKL